MRGLIKSLILTGIGGLLYMITELIWRGRTHWTMSIVGGLCFLLIGLINEVIPWEMKFWKQCLIGTGIVTVVEFFSGIVINLIFKLDVWDYSNLPFNLLGQICLVFCILWFFVSAIAIVLDDFLRYWIFEEEKPHYFL